MEDSLVSVMKNIDILAYPESPFHPPEIFPEFSSFEVYPFELNPENHVYSTVRTVLSQLALDPEHVGTSAWNPLKSLVMPHNHIVIKPNLVFDTHPLGVKGFEALVTHASITRVIIDYILLATRGKCTITICDVPLQTANWQNLIKQSQYLHLVSFYAQHGIHIQLLDLRYEISQKNRAGVVTHREKRIRDPLGYTLVDLQKRSYLYEIRHDAKKLEITDYGRYTVSRHHYDSKNEYYIANTILDADVFINVPKLKTHRKAGVSLSLKNLIGINGDKSWIAHHRRGIDEYPCFRFSSYIPWYLSYYLKNYAPRFLATFAYYLYQALLLRGKSIKEYGMIQGGTTMEGNWYGNDTVWRTILDLNNILFFCDKHGVLQTTRQRKYLTIIDGIIGMEKEGPLDGLPKLSQLIVAGFHPVAVDYIASYHMGFDYTKIPAIREGFQEKFFHLTDFTPDAVKTAGSEHIGDLNLRFEPTKGWKGYIER